MTAYEARDHRKNPEDEVACGNHIATSVAQRLTTELTTMLDHTYFFLSQARSFCQEISWSKIWKFQLSTALIESARAIRLYFFLWKLIFPERKVFSSF